MTSPPDLRTTTVGRQTVIPDDNLAVLRALPAASVDVIPTSPPYNIGVLYGLHDDRKPREVYLDWLGERLTELHRVLKPTGSFFLNLGTGTKDDMMLPFAIIDRVLAAGFVLQNRVVWVKAVTINGITSGQFKPITSARYLTRTFEDVLHFTKSGDVQLSKLAVGVPLTDKSNLNRYGHTEDCRDGGNVWFIRYDTVQAEKDHPAAFPVELPELCIKLHGAQRADETSPWIVPSDLVVLDPFLGSGSTLVAAERLGCHGVGIEIDLAYVKVAVRRLRATATVVVDAVHDAPTIGEFKSKIHRAPAGALSSPRDLLRAVNDAGVQVRLCGGQVEFRPARGLSPELRDALRAHRNEIWRHLGGPALDAAPLALLQQLKVELLIPKTIREAIAALTQVERDSDQHTAHNKLIGLDIETAALPGLEVRAPTKLKRDGTPAKVQPSFKGTAALDPHSSRIRLVQVYGGGTHCVVLDLDLLSRSEVGRLLSTWFLRSRTPIFHNASFELRFLGAAGIEVLQYEDTMQAAGLLLGVRQRSLEAAAEAYLGISVPKSLQTSDWSAPVLSPGQHAYAALDAIITFRLWLKLYPELIQKDRVTAYELQRNVIRVAVAMVDRGITLDRARHQQQIDEWRSTLALATRAFQTETGQLPPGTPAETVEYLKKVLPEDILATWPTTAKTGAMSTKAANLRRHVVQVPAIRDLLSIRATQTLLNNFGDTLLGKISARTGRLHPGLNIGSTKAGRSSASNPNIQQIPKHKSPALRAAMVAAAGYRFIIGDYNAMELRAAAEVSNDQVMRQDFADGIDPHRRQAAAMLGIPEEAVTADQRDAAKPINFGTIYGAGPVGLAASAWNGYGILLTPDEAGAGRQAFLSRYYTFARWMREHYARCTEAGRIEIGCFGRVIEAAWETPKHSNGRNYRSGSDDDDDDYGNEDDSEFFDEWTNQGWAASALKYTLCCNAPIQGACADIGMLALLLFDAALKQERIDGNTVLFVHDELAAEVATDQADRAAQLLQTSMEQAFTAVFPDAPVNGLIEIAIRKSWGKSP